MRGPQLLFFFLASVATMLGVDAFAPPASLRTVCRQQHHRSAAIVLPRTALRATKDTSKGTSTVDYGKIAVMFVNPLNPYSWFLYMLAGITIYGSLNP